MGVVVNRILSNLNNPISRPLLKVILKIGYRSKSVKPELIQFHEKFNAWEYRINGVSYFSTGAGWAYTEAFLTAQLKRLSCNQYVPKAGDIVFDIGAGVGEETIIFSKLVGPEGKVFAIEAHPKTFGALQLMVSRNMLKNVTTCDVAFSDKEGVVEIDDTDNSLANTIGSTGSAKSFQIKGQTLDSFVEQNNIKRIDFVKMNIEGAEQLVILGMVNSLPIIRHMAISCHDFLYLRGESEFFKTKEIVIRFLEGNGFNVITQQTNENMVDDYVYASNPKFVV